jgi:preprotein translocase subunit SecE
VAKAVKNSKDAGKEKPGKARGKAPAKQGRAAQSRARAQSRPAAKGEKRGIAKFMHDVRVEMGKVTWPTRQDLVQSTIVVLVAVAIAAAFTGVADLVFSQFVQFVLNLIS